MKKINRTRKRTTKWNLFFHYFTVLYPLISGVLLVPLYINFIPIDLYGAWLATSNVIAWIGIVDPGLSTVIMQRVSGAYGKQDQVALNGLLTNSIVLSFTLAILIISMGFLLAPFVFQILGLPNTTNFFVLKNAFATAVLGTALMVLSYGFTAINQGFQSSLGIGLISAFINLASIGLTVCLLIAGHGLMALPLGLVFRGASLSLGNAGYLIWRVRADGMPVSFSLVGIKDLAKLLAYTFWGRAAAGISANLDALVITRFLGPEFAPAYVLTKRAPELSYLFLERPAVAFMPAIASFYESGNLEGTRVILLRLLRMIVWLSIPAIVGFFFLNEFFLRLWVGGSFYAGTTINTVIVVGVALSICSSVLHNLCYALGNIKGNSIAVLAQSVINVPLMIFGAMYFGMLGIALVPIIGFMCIASWYYPRTFARQLRLSTDDVVNFGKEIGLACIAGLIASLAIFFVNPGTWVSFGISAMSLSVAYLLTLFIVSAAFRKELMPLVLRIFPMMIRRG